jgi:hypothetical protein
MLVPKRLSPGRKPPKKSIVGGLVGRVLLRHVKAGSSYLAQNGLRIHSGLGRAPRADRLEILWPSGVVDVLFNMDANQIVTVREGAGAVGQKEFSAPRAAR